MLPAGRCGRKEFFRIDLDGLAAGKKRPLYISSWRAVFDFFNVRIASAHDLSPKKMAA